MEEEKKSLTDGEIFLALLKMEIEEDLNWLAVMRKVSDPESREDVASCILYTLLAVHLRVADEPEFDARARALLEYVSKTAQISLSNLEIYVTTASALHEYAISKRLSDEAGGKND